MRYNRTLTLPRCCSTKEPTSHRESSLLVSVILPAGEDIELLDRAVSSVLQQTFADWELLMIGWGSVDGIHEDMRPWTRQDRRIRVIQTGGSDDSGGCRELGLNWARGEFVAHLDACDEYYPDYLEHVAQYSDKADVSVFGYDLVQKNGTLVEHVARRGPPTGHNVFAAKPVAPLGIAHRRTIVDPLGGFYELLWQQEDSDLWRRLTLAKAQLVFVPFKSGRHRVSISRVK